MLTKFRIEHTECDYKREVEHTKTKSWLKSVSAFANGIGGMLIFGIDDETRKPSPIADVQSDDSRVEKENFPERAIHELMVNALVHRDYGVLGSEIHIDIFDDRIEIQNPGGMYDGVPVQNQDLENIISTRRNPVIADLMNRMDFMERRGSGFRKILAAVKFAPNYREENLPVFKSTPFSFTAIVKNMNFLGKGEQKIENVLENVLENVQDNVLEKDRKTILLELIQQNPAITLALLSKKLKVTVKTVQRDLDSLKKSGIIERVGSDREGKWVIKK